MSNPRCDHHRHQPIRQAARPCARSRRLESRGDRARARRRHLHQRRLHADQDDGGERPRGVSRTARAGLRREHRPRQGRHARRPRSASAQSSGSSATGARRAWRKPPMSSWSSGGPLRRWNAHRGESETRRHAAARKQAHRREHGRAAGRASDSGARPSPVSRFDEHHGAHLSAASTSSSSEAGT